MNIEEYEEEIKEVQGEIDEGPSDQPEEDEQADLWEALNHLESAIDMFDLIIDDDGAAKIAVQTHLDIYKLRRKIQLFLDQWDLSNSI